MRTRRCGAAERRADAKISRTAAAGSAPFRHPGGSQRKARRGIRDVTLRTRGTAWEFRLDGERLCRCGACTKVTAYGQGGRAALSLGSRVPPSRRASLELEPSVVSMLRRLSPRNGSQSDFCRSIARPNGPAAAGHGDYALARSRRSEMPDQKQPPSRSSSSRFVASPTTAPRPLQSLAARERPHDRTPRRPPRRARHPRPAPAPRLPPPLRPLLPRALALSDTRPTTDGGRPDRPEVPLVLDLLASGAVNLTTVRLLGPPDGDNHAWCSSRPAGEESRGRGDRARLAPRPDVPASVRKRPVRTGAAAPAVGRALQGPTRAPQAGDSCVSGAEPRSLGRRPGGSAGECRAVRAESRRPSGLGRADAAVAGPLPLSAHDRRGDPREAPPGQGHAAPRAALGRRRGPPRPRPHAPPGRPRRKRFGSRKSAQLSRKASGSARRFSCLERPPRESRDLPVAVSGRSGCATSGVARSWRRTAATAASARSWSSIICAPTPRVGRATVRQHPAQMSRAQRLRGAPFLPAAETATSFLNESPSAQRCRPAGSHALPRRRRRRW